MTLAEGGVFLIVAAFVLFCLWLVSEWDDRGDDYEEDDINWDNGD